MAQCWNCLTKVWNWNRLLLKDIFRDEIKLLLNENEWKMFDKLWENPGGKTYSFVHGIVYKSLFRIYLHYFFFC